MRIVFVGSTRLSARCLNEVVVMPGSRVVGIVTNPETFKISYNPDGVRNVMYGNLVDEAKQHGIPSYIMQDIMSEPGLSDALAAWKPDFILVIGWYHMVPRKIREMAPLGCAGVHASLLPRYRGGAPLVWAMINGERETGVSLFHLSDGVDDGDIIGQKSFEIAPADTIAEVLTRCEEVTISLLRQYLPAIAEGNAPRIQQDVSRATVFQQRSPEDGRIDWQWSAEKIKNFIKAQTRPYPGAFTDVGGKRLRIWNADVEELTLQSDGDHE